MRLLLVIAMFVASLSFTGVVKAADFCADHDCQHEMTVAPDDAPSNAPEQPCNDCCLHHCGHMVFSGKVQNVQLPLILSKYSRIEPPSLQGREPAGLFRPPQAV